MNILYITFLNGNKGSGPTYSVPRQISAQSEFDNVFWYDVCHSRMTGTDRLFNYYDLSAYPEGTIAALPEPFCRPDLIVVEQFYDLFGRRILLDLLTTKIPYVIVPRGELTGPAQKQKRLKKLIGNLFVFKRLARRAAGIQYLTHQEKEDSGNRWNPKSLILPNGIDEPKFRSSFFRKDSLQCIMIGRIAPYQKGLDLLVEACSEIKTQLRDAGVKISIFGPNYENKLSGLINSVKSSRLEDIISFHGAVFDSEKQQALLNADLFLMTSRFEGHPMSLIEALSYGLPCIVTTGSNMREEVEQYNAGWTADNNAGSIKRAMLKMIRETEQLKAKSSNAVRLANCYNWNKIADQSHEEYLLLLEGCHECQI